MLVTAMIIIMMMIIIIVIIINLQNCFASPKSFVHFTKTLPQPGNMAEAVGKLVPTR